MPSFILSIPYTDVDCAIVQVNCESRVFGVAVVRFAYVDDKIIANQLNWGFNSVLLRQALKIFVLSRSFCSGRTNLGKVEKTCGPVFYRSQSDIYRPEVFKWANLLCASVPLPPGSKSKKTGNIRRVHLEKNSVWIIHIWFWLLVPDSRRARVRLESFGQSQSFN